MDSEDEWLLELVTSHNATRPGPTEPVATRSLGTPPTPPAELAPTTPPQDPRKQYHHGEGEEWKPDHHDGAGEGECGSSMGRRPRNDRARNFLHPNLPPYIISS